MAYNSKYTGTQIDSGIDAANAALPKSGGIMTGDLNLGGKALFLDAQGRVMFRHDPDSDEVCLAKLNLETGTVDPQRLSGIGDATQETDAVNLRTLTNTLAQLSGGGGMRDGYCSTAASMVAKAEQGFITDTVTNGMLVGIWFVNTNTADSPTLKVNGVTGAILGSDMAAISPAALTKGMHLFVRLERYDGWWMAI